ncbi:MAG TPA: peptide chain release factor N(5)-glutamine methyltransferase [Polyangiales bacterium]
MSGTKNTWTVRSMVAWMQADFERRSIESARLEADLLVAHALGVKRIALFLDPDRPLVDGELAKIRALVERRRAREPIAYILGEREFYGRPFEVNRDVLIPRPDTETLIDLAKEFLASAPEGRVLDLCTGSGAIAITLALEAKRAAVATDVSEAALSVARRNAARHGVAVEFAQGDLFAALTPEKFACVTVNPPYIPSGDIAGLDADVRDHEPRLALAGGADGLDFYRRIARDVRAYLADGGALFMEIGIGQAADVCALFAGFAEVSVARDLSGMERVVSARC